MAEILWRGSCGPAFLTLSPAPHRSCSRAPHTVCCPAAPCAPMGTPHGIPKSALWGLAHVHQLCLRPWGVTQLLELSPFGPQHHHHGIMKSLWLGQTVEITKSNIPPNTPVPLIHILG